jgi:CheY-like chemotaxis protein
MDLAPGSYISVQIRDEGPGIPDENLENIFDPFFSTKETGSGLGLTVAHSIVKRHKGRISVQSSIKEGTIVEVLIPEIKGEKKSENKNINSITNGTGSILIMDDDENIIKILGSMLDVMGYSYDSVTNGDEAIDLYKEKAGNGQPYSFVILDITIAGGMGGINCAEQILDLDKGAKIIFSSGYSSDSVSNEDFRGSKIVFLEKPYRIDELSKAISSLITN